MIVRRGEEEGDNEETGRKGGGESMVVQASFKGFGTEHPLTSKTLIPKRCLPVCFCVSQSGGAEAGPPKVTRRKKYPLEIYFRIPISRGSNRVFRGGEEPASVARSLVLQQTFLLLQQ